MEEKKTLLGGFGQWWAQPFNASGSALAWVLFVGLLIIAAFMWQTVLILGFGGKE